MGYNYYITFTWQPSYSYFDRYFVRYFEVSTHIQIINMTSSTMQTTITVIQRLHGSHHNLISVMDYIGQSIYLSILFNIFLKIKYI